VSEKKDMRALLDSVMSLRFRPLEEHPRCLSLMDFGADTLKAAVVRREQSGVRVLGYGFASARGCDLSGGRAAVDALVRAADEALTAAEDQTVVAGWGKVVPDDVLFCVPARLTRGRAFVVRHTRSDLAVPITAREVKDSWYRLERLARERLPRLGQDGVALKPLALTPSVTTVDGHHVSDPVGLKGQVLALSAFGVAVRPSVLRAAEAVARRLELALLGVVAAPQSLATLVPRRDAVLIDIGWGGTSLNLIQHDSLVASHWWPQGGDFFTRGFSDAFGCSPEEAEALKRAHASHTLSQEDERLIAQPLSESLSVWFEALVDVLSQVGSADAMDHRVSPGYDVAVATVNGSLLSQESSLLPGRIYLTGGGSLLPGLSSVVGSLESVRSLGFRRSVEVESLGRCLGTRWPGRQLLLDVPPPKTGDLLTSAMSLASCVPW
jgi:cell division ATPase FtsA